MELKGRKIILTGGSSGIGLELLYVLNGRGGEILAVGLEDFDPGLSSVTYMKEDISTEEAIW